MKKRRLDANGNPIISSSEIKVWSFCPRQWMLFQITGRKVNNEATRRGLSFHHRKAEDVHSIQRTERSLAAIYVVAGILLCVLLLFLSRCSQ